MGPTTFDHGAIGRWNRRASPPAQTGERSPHLTPESRRDADWILALGAAAKQIGSTVDYVPCVPEPNVVAGWLRALTHSPGTAEARDAARYRHLRKYAQPQWRNGPGLYWYLPRGMPQSTPAEQLDANIDAALKGQQ